MSKTELTTTNDGPPAPDEYHPGAIQKAVIQYGLKHPVTIYPIALGISTGIIGALFNLPLLLGVALVVGLVGPLWGVSQLFFRHDALGSRYLDSLHHRQKQYEAFLIDQIEAGLKNCCQKADLSSKAETGIAQLKSIQVKLENVQELLSMKLKPTELTYGRFLGAAEQVALSVLDNLNTVVSLLKSAASIEPGYIEERLQSLQGTANPTQAQEDQYMSLKDRLELWNSQLTKVDQLMARNEEAMTEMERISAAVAQWQTGRKFAGSDFESAIKQLHALAANAHEYDNV